MICITASRRFNAFALFVLGTLGLCQSDARATPVSVVITGSLQSELGCPGDYQPACSQTALAYDATDAVWQRTLSLPAGNFSYFAAIDGGFAETYGANGGSALNPITLNLASSQSVKFYYADQTHWITDSVNSIIAVLAGSFQSELGCSGDFDPSCLRSWLQDIDGDGIYSLTAQLPDGDYSTVIAINESFDESYGLGGVAKGPNIDFTVSNRSVTFCYDSKSHILDIGSGACSTVSPPGGTVPEPGTFALAGLALAGIAASRRRKQWTTVPAHGVGVAPLPQTVTC